MGKNEPMVRLEKPGNKTMKMIVMFVKYAETEPGTKVKDVKLV